MLLVITESLFPLIGFSIVGITMILFPRFVLNLKNFNASMKGSMFDNDLSFRPIALIITRVFGFLFIGLGVYIFLLVNDIIGLTGL